MKKQVITDWITEAEAAQMLQLAPRTLRKKVTASGHYTGQQPLPLIFSQIGRRYHYSLSSIHLLLTMNSNI